MSPKKKKKKDKKVSPKGLICFHYNSLSHTGFLSFAHIWNKKYPESSQSSTQGLYTK
jgi:hypothetical protein